MFRADDFINMDINKVKNNLDFLRDVHTSSLQRRRQRFQRANKDEVDFICDCAFNILRKNIPISNDQLTELRRPNVRKAVYLLADNNVPYARRQQIVANQSGGIILPILAPILGGVFSSLLSSILGK